MKWFNYWGLVIFAVIIIPNILFAIQRKEGFENKFHNKTVSILEQIGRYGSMFFMVLNIPFVSKGFWFKSCLAIYLIINSLFLAFYCAVWAFSWNKNSKFKVLSLSITPCLIFLFSGAILVSIPLIMTATVFAIGHITMSIKNYILKR